MLLYSKINFYALLKLTIAARNNHVIIVFVFDYFIKLIILDPIMLSLFCILIIYLNFRLLTIITYIFVRPGIEIIKPT